jgi:hypothetical protein
MSDIFAASDTPPKTELKETPMTDNETWPAWDPKATHDPFDLWWAGRGWHERYQETRATLKELQQSGIRECNLYTQALLELEKERATNKDWNSMYTEIVIELGKERELRKMLDDMYLDVIAELERYRDLARQLGALYDSMEVI